jgi:cell division protein FtsI/penicillin-binding protein 2
MTWASIATLADAHRNGVPLVPGFLKAFELPFAGRHVARALFPWYQGDTIPVGIGQGYWTATPIQMNKALMILINDSARSIPV